LYSAPGVVFLPQVIGTGLASLFITSTRQKTRFVLKSPFITRARPFFILITRVGPLVGALLLTFGCRKNEEKVGQSLPRTKTSRGRPPVDSGCTAPRPSAASLYRASEICP